MTVMDEVYGTQGEEAVDRMLLIWCYTEDTLIFVITVVIQ
jgi:hypothetical protein